MYCPKCGTEAISESKYCRLCGINLLPVSMLIKGQDIVTSTQVNGDITSIISQSRLMQCGIATLFIGLVATIFFGVLNLDKLAGISSAVLIAGAGLTVFPWLPGLMIKELGKNAVQPIEQQTTNSLESNTSDFISQVKQFKTSEMYTIPSVTENTTLKLDESKLREKVNIEHEPK